MTNSSKIFLSVSLVLLVSIFVWQQVLFWNGALLNAQAQTVDNAPVNQDAIDNTKSDISDVQKELDKKLKIDAKLNQNLGENKKTVGVVQSNINKTQSLIKDTAQNISRKEEEINNLNDQITLQRDLLKSLIQQVYYNQSQPVFQVVLSSKDFSQFFSDTDQYLTLNDKIREISDQLSENVARLQQDKVDLADRKQEHEKNLSSQVDKKQDLLVDQIAIQQDITDNQKTIDKLKKELSELQGDLNTLLGKSYSAKNIMDAVSFASDKTNVPKGFLIGVLKMETNLGANVGGCTYAQVEDGATANYKKGKLGKVAYSTFLKRREIFKDITDELNLDYRKQKVSCNPSGYTGTGGAMGVAQFMPDTWVGYKSQVAANTGNNPPSPWDLGDGVMAMALKLGKTPGVTDGKKSAFKTAACSYLGTCYAPYINGILYWADNYKDLID